MTPASKRAPTAELEALLEDWERLSAGSQFLQSEGVEWHSADKTFVDNLRSWMDVVESVLSSKGRDNDVQNWRKARTSPFTILNVYDYADRMKILLQSIILKVKQEGQPVDAQEPVKITAQEVRRHVRRWVKENSVLASHIGDVELGKQIGEGGTALVFESEFAGGTAVKFLVEPVSSRPSTRYKRFLSEYVNLVRLVPTGVTVPLYHFGIQDMAGVHVPYIVMERCVKTLYEQYRDSKLQEAGEFGGLLERLLAILETVHKAGIVHRDIKPKNILMRSNGEWVLGDFGISWFDPQFYAKLAETKKGDRLANWGFSAPEQFRRDAYDKATPSMDLYAMGQTLYYCVSGQCIAGSNYPRFAEIAPLLREYDSLIHKLVRQVPGERFQSVDEVRGFLKEEKSTGHFDYKHLANEQAVQIPEFDRRLARGMPGAFDYTQARDRDEIDRVLASLAENCEQYNLWWTRGRSHFYVKRMEQVSEEIWLIHCFECQVMDLWVYRHPTLERQYVIIQLAPRPPFGVHDPDASIAEIEEAGYFQGRYVTRAEYDDGYALINGEVVQITGVELRCRNLKDDFLILAPGTSVYLQGEGYIVHQVYLSLREAGKVDPALLKPLESIEREWWMRIYD